LRTRRLLVEQVSSAWVLYKLDGGIDHILVDEAQDTSPAQWQIVKALAEEFSDVFDGALCHGTVVLLVIVTLNTFPWFGNRSRALRVFPDALGGAWRKPKSKESEVRTRETSQGRSISTAEPLTRTE